MPTIKGPIVFKKGEPIPDKVMNAIDNIKSPFEAKKLAFKHKDFDYKEGNFVRKKKTKKK